MVVAVVVSVVVVSVALPFGLSSYSTVFVLSMHTSG